MSQRDIANAIEDARAAVAAQIGPGPTDEHVMPVIRELVTALTGYVETRHRPVARMLGRRMRSTCLACGVEWPCKVGAQEQQREAFEEYWTPEKLAENDEAGDPL